MTANDWTAICDKPHDIRLIVADMDGTLLDGDSNIPDDFWPLLDELHAKGVEFVPASGRQLATLRSMFADRVDGAMSYIAENGNVVVADDNVIDYLVLERDGGKLKFRVNANSTENISVSVTVPASASLREISAGSYGKVNCKMPLKGPSVSVSVSSYGSVSADIDTPGAAKLDVSSYGKFAGSVRCSDGELRISSYGSAQAPVECRNSCKLTVGSYAKFSNDIKASDLTVEVSSGASVGSTLTADALTMRIDSYAKFSGTVTVNARQAKLTVSSGGSFNGTFSGSSLEASVGSYGKIYLKGAAQVADATVRVSSGANFSAPELRVSDYDLTVSNYAKADVWCSGRLKINASTAAKVTYGGPCTVETVSDNIQRRK